MLISGSCHCGNIAFALDWQPEPTEIPARACTSGVVPVVTSTIEGMVYTVVSVNAFDNVKPDMLRPGSVSFDGEGTGDRLARRQRNWIGRVEFRNDA